MLTLLPAIDLKSGHAVRLLQGRDEDTTVYGSDPVGVAKSFAEQGATWLHVVNLDGAFGRASNNLAIVERIAKETGVKVEFGGGLRSAEDVDAAISIGVSKAVIGTLAFEMKESLAELVQRHGASKIVVAIDAKDGIVATRAWTKSSGMTVVEAARAMLAMGIEEVLYTDVGRDGMQTGPDIATMKQVLRETSIKVIASGGIGKIQDLADLRDIRHPNLSGVVVGNALYEKTFTVKEALGVLVE